jgi:WhiB family redox-sensing transcriptional regulator
VSWRTGAACLGADSALFFPGDDADDEQVARAKAICAACAVRTCCLQHALEHREHHGIWGGATEAERRRILRQRRRRLASTG